MQKILIVDDDVQLCAALSEEFYHRGYITSAVYTADDAIDQVKSFNPDIIFLDLKMPGKGGFDVLRALNSSSNSIPIIVLTAYADVRSAIDAAKLGASDFISKPYNFEELMSAVNRLTGTKSLS
ncbi:MAG: response regulator [Ignavibacteriales bacterium]|nr:MAG: response regulator [Ignavibacteriales bacterium]